MGKPGIEPGTSAFLTNMILEEFLIIGKPAIQKSPAPSSLIKVVMSAAL
jgi:hypothetical protein